MNKTFLSLILVALIAAPLTAFGNVASVQAASINTAIRGESQQTVYWYANDGKRYVFPNAATYFTWFTGFDNVQNISDSELFTIPLGGNVTYRPGAKLVKINTDPKVYAVSRGGLLRHVTSESLANQLYGYDWASKVQDIPVEYFANYTVGSPIYNVSDYNVSNEYAGVFSPSDSLRTQGQNGTNQNGSLTLSADRTSIMSGQAVNLTGTYFGTLPSGGYLDIKDVRNSNTIKTCYNTSVCNVTVNPMVDSSQNSVQYYIVAKNGNGTHIGTQYSPVIYTNGISGSTQTPCTSQPMPNYNTGFMATRAAIRSGETVTLCTRPYVTTSQTLLGWVNTRYVFTDTRDGSIVSSCAIASPSCDATVNPIRRNNESYVRYRADSEQNGVRTTGSEEVTVYFNETGASDSLHLNLSSSYEGNNNGTVNAQAIGTNYPQNYRIEVYWPSNQLLRVCWNATKCEPKVYLNSFSNAGPNWTFRARLLDANGNLVEERSTTIAVTDGTSNGALTLTADRTSIHSGDAVNLNAMYSGSPQSGYRMEIREHRSNTLVKTCYDTLICNVSVNPIQNGYPNTTYLVTLFSNAGVQFASQYSQVIMFTDTTSNGTSNDGVNFINGLTLQSDRTSAANGDMVKLTANAHNTGNWSYVDNRIEIRDVRTGAIVKTCHDQSWCVVDVAVQGFNGTAQYETRIYDRNGNFVMSQFGPVIYVSGTSSNTGSTSSYSANITYPYNGQVLTNFPRTLNIMWSGTARRHQVEVSCNNACWPIVGQNAYTAYLTTDGYANSVNTTLTGDDNVTIRVRGINEDYTYGAWSNSISFRFSTGGSTPTNTGTGNINGLTLQSDRTSIANGDMVKLTANAYNTGNYSYTGNRIEIRDVRTGSIVRTCNDQSWCIADVAVTGNNGTAQYEARIYNTSGNLVLSQFGPVIYVSGTSTGTGSTGTGSVAQIPNTDIHIAPTYNVHAGGSVYLTASFTNLPYTSTDTVIRLYTEGSTTAVGTCSGSVSCSVPYTIPASGVNTHVYGVASNSSLTNTRETAHIPLYAF